MEAETEAPKQTAEEAVRTPGSCTSQEDGAEEPPAAPGASSAIFIRKLPFASLTADLQHSPCTSAFPMRFGGLPSMTHSERNACSLQTASISVPVHRE